MNASSSVVSSRAPYVRRFLLDYARNPVNLVMLILVPVIFVLVAAGPMADAAELLGGPGGPAVEAATAGWAAGFIAAIAMYFQMREARAADRRLVMAGLRVTRLAGARMVTGLALAMLASAASLTALAVRTGVHDPGRIMIGTLMFAVIYLAIGALIGALMSNPVNGATLVLFVWLLDVVLGPVMRSADWAFTRVFPTHFVTLWMVDLPSRHAGRPGDLGWALVWTAGAVTVSGLIVLATTRVSGRTRRRAPAGSLRDQLKAGLRMGALAEGRNRVLWALLAVVPAVFVLLAVPATPDEPEMFTLREGGRTVTEQLSLRDIHPGTMAPIAVASLAMLAGMFVMLDAAAADQRLSLAGFRTGGLLGSRLAVVCIAAAVAAGASLAVTGAVFDAGHWGVYAAGLLLAALIYALIGVVLGPLFGRVGGVFIAFLVPFLDLGLEQSPMLHPTPPGWAQALPGYGPGRIVVDGGLTGTFDETRALSIALAWLTVLLVAATLLFRRTAGVGARS